MIKLNYTPDRAYPLTISKTTSRWFIYEQDEPEPCVKQSFNSAESAEAFANYNFPGYRILKDGLAKDEYCGTCGNGALYGYRVVTCGLCK